MNGKELIATSIIKDKLNTHEEAKKERAEQGPYKSLDSLLR